MQSRGVAVALSSGPCCLRLHSCSHLLCRVVPCRAVLRCAVADENLLGCLTETGPATFYTIMDLLVRKVHPDSLM